jgi:hypothetical protein
VSVYEYLELVTVVEGDRIRARWVNDQEQPDWPQVLPIAEHLRRLSEEGWELVGVSISGSGPWGSRLYTLRRPALA